MNKSTGNRPRVILAIFTTLGTVFVFFFFINSIPPCSIYDFGLHLKGCIHKLESGGPVFSLEYSADGHLLMSAGFDAPVYLWSMPDTSLIYTFKSEGEYPQQFGTLSQDGKMMAVYSKTTEQISILDAQSLQPLQIIDQSWGWDLEFSPRDPVLVYIGTDGRIHLWNISESNATVIENSTYPSEFSISPNGDILASVALHEDHKIQLYSLPDGQVLRTIELDENVDDFVFTSDGKFLLTATVGHNGSLVTYWNVMNGNWERSLQLAKFPETLRLALSPDNTTIAVGQKDCINVPKWLNIGLNIQFDDRCLTIWDTTTGKLVKEMPLRTRILALAFSPDGAQLAIAVEEAVYIWENPEH